MFAPEAIHPYRHEVTSDAGRGAASFRHLGRGVVRTPRAEIRHAHDGSRGLHLRRLTAVEPVGLGAKHLGDFGIKVQAQQPLGQVCRQGSDTQLLRERQEALVVVIHLADDAWPHVVAPVEQLALDLVLDDLASFLDDENLFEADGEFPDALRLQRPWHSDLQKPQTNLCGDLLGNAQFTQRLTDVLVAFSRRHDAEPRVRGIHGHAIDVVGARERDGGKTLVVLQAQVLIVTVMTFIPTQQPE